MASTALATAVHTQLPLSLRVPAAQTSFLLYCGIVNPGSVYDQTSGPHDNHLRSPFCILYTNFSQPSSSGLLGDLPAEFFILILSYCSVAAILTMVLTSKAVRATIIAEEIVHRVLKEPISFAQLRWIRPVDSAEESTRADEALSTWLPSGIVGQSTPPLSLRHFPCLAFATACYASDSFEEQAAALGSGQVVRRVVEGLPG